MIVTPTQPASQTLASAANAKSTAGADFNMFLKLLTTQMQNQDPLDPMKASEYTQDVAQASGLIGRDAIFASATAGLGAGPATWTYDLPAAGRNIVASIANSSGKVVATRSLADGTGGGFAWDGMLANGTRAADGAYQLSIAATDAAGKTLPATISSTGRVSEVTMVNGMPALGINGVALPVSALIKVAAASS
jgi:flagellar basal-body rod modification protein FlgD